MYFLCALFCFHSPKSAEALASSSDFSKFHFNNILDDLVSRGFLIKYFKRFE